MSELQKISRSVMSSSRIRKSDVDDAKRQCEKFARIRDEVSNDSRRQAIPNEIKELKKSIEGSQTATSRGQETPGRSSKM